MQLGAVVGIVGTRRRDGRDFDRSTVEPSDGYKSACVSVPIQGYLPTCCVGCSVGGDGLCAPAELRALLL